MKKILSFILISFCIVPAFTLCLGQSYLCAPCKELQIVAPSGLSLRTEPSLTADKITVIPFGKSVKNYGPIGEEVEIGGIANKWVRVQYRAKAGYAFGGYLSTLRQIQSTYVNRQVRLEFETNCDSEINFDPTLNWYGISWDWKKNSGRLKKMSPQIITSENTEELGMMDFILKDAQKGKAFRFEMGTDKVLDTTRKIQDFSPKEYLSISKNDTSFQVGDLTFEIADASFMEQKMPHIRFYDYVPQRTAFLCRIKRGEMMQELSFPLVNWDEAGIEKNYTALNLPVYIRFAGDLDGDGHTDLLIQVGYEDYAQHVLFLSSYATQDQLLRAVATRTTYPCC